ncbi:MAG: hypothetical protein KDD29_03835 [Flavobacteriales bacterium]|nr:hypothetical protein [Flavobacteriales bacterium]MCB9335783.1 hypothetical protein [Flavobacteriales bacterium]
MKLLTSLFFYLTSLTVIAQSSFYDNIQLGDYTVGFYDSIIFCTDEKYAQYEYEGDTPLFLQIWQPIAEPTKNDKLMVCDFRKRNLDSNLLSVYNPLCQKMDSAFVWYNIQEDFVNFDPINYGQYSYFDVLDTIKNYKTRSYYSKNPINSNLPIIIYHHGAQGLSDENFVLAEYFASRGYIVVSSNYHLPYKNETYGYSEGSEKEDINLTKRVIEFARSLTTSNEVYYIGHSLGAQIGFSFLHEQGWANAFVSMETTLEFWDSTKIKEMWPKLDSLMSQYEKDYSLPILMLANTRENKPFNFFSGITNTTTIHASAKEEFGHESYTSGYLLRYLYKDQFTQPDTLELKRQLELYSEHLLLIEDFINSCSKGTSFNHAKYEPNFYINKYNANKN